MQPWVLNSMTMGRDPRYAITQSTLVGPFINGQPGASGSGMSDTGRVDITLHIGFRTDAG